MKKPRLLLAVEAAQYLRKSEGTLRNWRYQGKGPKWLVVGGHEVRYRQEDIDRWLDQQCSAA